MLSEDIYRTDDDCVDKLGRLQYKPCFAPAVRHAISPLSLPKGIFQFGQASMHQPWNDRASELNGIREGFIGLRFFVCAQLPCLTSQQTHNTEAVTVRSHPQPELSSVDMVGLQIVSSSNKFEKLCMGAVSLKCPER